MLCSIQAYLEDYLNRRGISDIDGFAVKLANLYFNNRASSDQDSFLRKVSGIRTVLYANNGISDRSRFDAMLIDRLDSRFKKKLIDENPVFPGGTEREKNRIARLPKLTIEAIVSEFRDAVQARAIDIFWHSRTRGHLRDHPEKIAQGLFAVFTRGVLRDSGIVLRELASGIGFVDIGIILSRTLHLIEIKVLRGELEGPSQLNQYMKTEGRPKGTLLVIDTIPTAEKTDLPTRIEVEAGLITVSIK